MTRSIFDPTGDPERSGSAMTPPDADQISQLPEEFVNPSPSLTAGSIDFDPSERPKIEISTEDDWKLIIVELTGKLSKDDFHHFFPVVQKAVGRHGKIRMLVRMHDFHGWHAGALWEEIKFDVKHFNDFERVAIVGETTWEKWMVAFSKPFTTAKVRYFPVAQSAEARTWITSE